MKELLVFVRTGCHLCDDMLVELAGFADQLGFTVRTEDVDRDPAWQAQYGDKVPVLLCDGREVCHYFLDLPALRRCL